MPGFRWLAGSLVLALSLYICALNIVILRARYRHEYHSFIPLLGSLFGIVGILILPLHGMYRWIWLPLIADLWSLLCFATVGYMIVKKAFRLIAR